MDLLHRWLCLAFAGVAEALTTRGFVVDKTGLRLPGQLENLLRQYHDAFAKKAAEVND